MDATESVHVLQPSMRERFQIDAGSVTAMLLVSTLSLLMATLAILLHTLASMRHMPLLRSRADGAIIEPPAVVPGGWHALVSHVWSTGQDQARVLKERLQAMVPGLRLFLE